MKICPTNKDGVLLKKFICAPHFDDNINAEATEFILNERRRGKSSVIYVPKAQYFFKAKPRLLLPPALAPLIQFHSFYIHYGQISLDFDAEAGAAAVDGRGNFHR
jgi:hypothetical protein